jgi:hypothetical protein
MGLWSLHHNAIVLVVMNILKPQDFSLIIMLLVLLGLPAIWLFTGVSSTSSVSHTAVVATPATPASAPTNTEESISLSSPDQDSRTTKISSAPTHTAEITKSETLKTPEDAIPGEYLFRFYNSADLAAFKAYARAHGIEVIDSMSWGNIVRIRLRDRSMLKKLLRDGPVAVDWQPNLYVRVPERDDNKPQVPDGTYKSFGTQAMEWVGLAHEDGRGKGIKVAVLDSGVNTTGALSDKSVETVDMYSEDGTSLHGTAVASIISGSESDFEGIAPDAELLSIRVLSDSGSGDAFTLAKGIVEAVDRGANIINMSLGSKSDSFVVRDAINYAVERGVLLVAAVGNDAVEGVLYPARYDDVLAVAAVDADGRHPYFSNRGSEVDIAAPGIGVAVPLDQDKLVGFSGTSAAAPFISGAAAWLWAQNPDLTPSEVTEILIDYSNDTGAPGIDEETGAGIVNITRVKERDTAGIRDMVLMPPYVTTDENRVNVDISAQNRGTEPLDEVSLTINAAGDAQVYSFYNVYPGATITQRFTFDAANNDGIELVFSVTIPGYTDSHPENNSMSSSINFNPAPTTQ